MSRLVCYTADQIPVVWDQVKGHVKVALDRGSSYTLEQVYKGLCSKEMQLWTSHRGYEIEAAVVTTIQTVKDVKGCLILTAGGSNSDEWIAYLPLMEDWARDNGCQEMRIYGRIGWAKRTGYDIKYTKMSKDL